MAYVLTARDHCTPSDCAAFRALTDRRQIVANMDERIYDGLITRYSPSWNAPAAGGGGSSGRGACAPSMPTGKPTNADFPTAASTPPVNIMTPEPGSAGAVGAARAGSGGHIAPLPSPRPAVDRRRAGAGGGQEAARAETPRAPRRSSWHRRRRLAARQPAAADERLMLSKAGAGR